MKDTEIVEGIKTKDNRIFNYLYQKYGPVLTAYVLKNNGTKEDGIELLQVTILKIWNIIVEGKYKDQGKFGGFLFTVAANTWKQELNKRKRAGTQALGKMELLLKDEGDEDLQWKIARHSKLDRIYQGIDELDDTCQELINLFHLQKVSLLEIAELKSYPYNNLKKRIFNCRKKLKRILATQETKQGLYGK